MKRNLFIISITAVILTFMWGFSFFSEEEIAEVTTISPIKRPIYEYINVTGRVKENKRINLYVESFTEIENVYVTVGEMIEKGERIADIKAIPTNKIGLPEYNLNINDRDYIEDIILDYLDGIENKAQKIICKKEETTIRSPINGTITEIKLDVGTQTVYPKKFITVSDFSDLYVHALIPEEYCEKIKQGSDVKIATRSGKQLSGGKIKTLYPVIKYIPDLTGNGTSYVAADITTDNHSDTLRPGATVDVKIIAQKTKNALTLPYECIHQDENNREFVFYVENDTVKKSFIVTGYEDDNYVQIKSGITEDMSIIIQSDDSDIRENMKVKEKHNR